MDENNSASASAARVSAAFNAVEAALRGLSKSERLKALKLAGAADDLIVRPLGAIAAMQQSPLPSRAAVNTVPGTRSASVPQGPSKVNRDPAVIQARAAVTASNEALRVRAHEMGVERLPNDDEIVVKHARAVAALKAARMGSGSFRDSVRNHGT
jgi:hypothetical protein